MIALRRPDEAQIGRVLAQVRPAPLTYAAVGATRGIAAPGFVVDHTRGHLGTSDEVFRRAKAALARWQQFELGWVRLAPHGTPVAVGEIVAVVAYSLGFWSVSPCRVLDVLDEPDRFAMTYGTLPGHLASGEERFLVERLADGTVWYDILAVSRPQHPLMWLGYPLARRFQRRFAHDSQAAMRRAVAASVVDNHLAAQV